MLTDVYKEIAHTGNKLQSMSNAVTVLLPKPGESSDLANYRPITLINVDCKLLAKCLNTSYFDAFLDQHIGPEQLCSVKRQRY